MQTVALNHLSLANDAPLSVIAGPCQIESTAHALMIARHMAAVCAEAGAQFIFKASFDKANRTSLSSTRGTGMTAGLETLACVKSDVGCPVLTDVHTSEQCAPVSEVVDVIQIPAFLCRQTDLLLAAGETGAAINVKKGQFMSPWDMVHTVRKIESTGNTNILLTERGSSFGYNTLVADMRALPIMAQTGYPVVMDCTHSVQQPGGQGSSSGGQREFAPAMARAAVALGVAAVFIETHEAPDTAPSDGPNMVPLDDMRALVRLLMRIDKIAKAEPLKL